MNLKESIALKFVKQATAKTKDGRPHLMEPVYNKVAKELIATNGHILNTASLKTKPAKVANYDKNIFCDYELALKAALKAKPLLTLEVQNMHKQLAGWLKVLKAADIKNPEVTLACNPKTHSLTLKYTGKSYEHIDSLDLELKELYCVQTKDTPFLFKVSVNLNYLVKALYLPELPKDHQASHLITFTNRKCIIVKPKSPTHYQALQSIFMPLRD